MVIGADSFLKKLLFHCLTFLFLFLSLHHPTLLFSFLTVKMPREHWEQFSKLMKLLLKRPNHFFFNYFNNLFLCSAARLAEDFVPNSFSGFYTVGNYIYSHSADEEQVLSFIIECYTNARHTQSYGFCGGLHSNTVIFTSVFPHDLLNIY